MSLSIIHMRIFIVVQRVLCIATHSPIETGRAVSTEPELHTRETMSMIDNHLSSERNADSSSHKRGMNVAVV